MQQNTSPNLIAHIKKHVALNEPAVEKLLTSIKRIQLKKGEHILKEGQICKWNYFVEKGCICMYFVNDKGIEKITQFALENWWLSDYLSLGNFSPSQFNIKAVEDTEVFAFDWQAHDKLLTDMPQLESYFRIMMQRAYGALQIRHKLVRDLSREETYLEFIRDFPDFVQRIPQYMLASYLGLTPEYLSEIRKKHS